MRPALATVEHQAEALQLGGCATALTVIAMLSVRWHACDCASASASVSKGLRKQLNRFIQDFCHPRVYDENFVFTQRAL